MIRRVNKSKFMKLNLQKIVKQSKKIGKGYKKKRRQKGKGRKSIKRKSKN